jgi:hypothetical protein
MARNDSSRQLLYCGMTMPGSFGVGKCSADHDPASNTTHPTGSKQGWARKAKAGL